MGLQAAVGLPPHSLLQGFFIGEAMAEEKRMMFYVSDAEKYGVEAAVLLHNIRFWCEKNAANNRNIYADSKGNMRAWTYNSAAAWEKLFPYWNGQKIRRLIQKLIEGGAIESGNHNKIAYDRTLWYCVLDEESIVQGKTIDSSEMNNGFDEGEQPIPDVNTDSKPDINTHASAAKKRKWIHPELDVPMTKGSYETLVEWVGKEKADDYVQQVIDWDAATGAGTLDFAARAKMFARKDKERKQSAEEQRIRKMMESLP